MGAMAVIVPVEIHDAINAEIDRALAGRPIADAERDLTYSVMLEHFDKYGKVPSIRLNPKETTNG